MKQLILSIFIFCIFSLFISSSCKKNKSANDCGCNSNSIKYNLVNISGSLAFYQYKNKWAITYQPLPGNYANYFPCNTNQDSLVAILQTANQTDIFQINFSGKVKGPCPEETFGITNGVTTFDYIILDSLKRN